MVCVALLKMGSVARGNKCRRAARTTFVCWEDVAKITCAMISKSTRLKALLMHAVMGSLPPSPSAPALQATPCLS